MQARSSYVVVVMLAALVLAGCRSSRRAGGCGAALTTVAPPVAIDRGPIAVVVASPAVPTSRAEAPAGPALWDELLRTYVEGDYVRYADWKAHPADLRKLDRFLAWQAEADVDAMPRADRIAFWINAYNSLNVKMILDHYPVHAPIDIPGYFDKIQHRVAGRSMTVSEAEYEHLIAEHKDMRAHFAVVCSDRGCLPLRGQAWTGATLDADLDAAARRFVADERHFKVDHDKRVIHISKIFEWYGEKFTKDPTRPAAKPELFLRPWVDAPTRALLDSGDYTVQIIEWNWTLNEMHGAAGATAGT